MQPGLCTKTRRFTQWRTGETCPSDLRCQRDRVVEGGGGGKDFILLFLASARHCPGHGKSLNTFLTAPSEPNRQSFTWKPSVGLCGWFVTTVPPSETRATGVFQVQPPVGPQKGPCIIWAFQVASALAQRDIKRLQYCPCR